MSNKNCPECETYRKGANCQACYLAEKKRRVRVEGKYSQTLFAIDKLTKNVNGILNPPAAKPVKPTPHPGELIAEDG